MTGFGRSPLNAGQMNFLIEKFLFVWLAGLGCRIVEHWVGLDYGPKVTDIYATSLNAPDVVYVQVKCILYSRHST